MRELSPDEVKTLGLEDETPPEATQLRELSPDEVKTLGLDSPDSPAPSLGTSPVGPTPEPRTPGAVETFANRVLGGMIPGDVANRLNAELQSMRGAGVKPSILNPFPKIPAQVTPEMAAAGTAEKRAEIDAENRRGGTASPWAAGVGNLAGGAAGIAMNPVASGVMGGVLKSTAPATKVLSGVYGPMLAKLLARGAAGGAVGGVGSVALGHDFDDGAKVGAAVGAAPGLTGVEMMADAALDREATDEERVTKGLGGLTSAVTGGMTNLRDAAPGLRKLAENQAARAIYGRNLKAIRRSGGAEGAEQVGGAMLDEGVVRAFDKPSQIADRALAKRNEVGTEIAQGLDDIGGTLSPEQSARLRPFVLAAKVGNDVLPGLENTAALRPLIPAANRITRDIRAVGGTEQAPISFAELNRQKAAYGDAAYKAANPFAPSPKASVLQDTYRSLNEHMESVGGDVAKGAGQEAFQQWLVNKDRYGNLAKATEAGATAAGRDLANRGVSLTDTIVGSGGGVTPKSIALGAANKFLRERGNSTAAVGLDALSKLGSKMPSPWGGEPPPAAPRINVLEPGPAGKMLFEDLPPTEPPPSGAPPLPPAGHVSGLPGPGNIPGNKAYNNAAKFSYQELVKRLQAKDNAGNAIVNPETGEVLLSADPALASGPSVPAGLIDLPRPLPAPVTPASSGALEALTPRLRNALGDVPEPTPPTKPSGKPSKTKVSPRRR